MTLIRLYPSEKKPHSCSPQLHYQHSPDVMRCGVTSRPLRFSPVTFPFTLISFVSSPSAPSPAATLPRQSAVRPGLRSSQPGGGRLLRTGVPGPAQDDGERHTLDSDALLAVFAD